MTILCEDQHAGLAALFFAAVFFMPLMALPVAAQEAGKVARTASSSPWQVRCGNRGGGMRCRAIQTIVLRKSRKRLLSLRVTRPKEGAAALMVTLPHGLFLPGGVSWRVDGGRPSTLEIQTCDGRGCYAGMPLDAQRLGTLKRGGQLVIGFQDIEKRKVQVPVSLKGFTDAVAKL